MQVRWLKLIVREQARLWLLLSVAACQFSLSSKAEQRAEQSGQRLAMITDSDENGEQSLQAIDLRMLDDWLQLEDEEIEALLEDEMPILVPLDDELAGQSASHNSEAGKAH